MTSFGLRYDLRCPGWARATPTALAEAAIEQCAWADERGFDAVTLSEHHGSPDGYLPSPLLLGAAIAARTRKLRLVLAALIAPLHDPIRLAEDLAVLDVVSAGRVVPVLGAGYVESEFRAFGRSLADRGRAMDEIADLLVRAWSGEPFSYRGAEVRVTPRPVQRPRPPILFGGASEAAARRAARIADHFVPVQPELFEVFRAERRALGRSDPGPLPPTLSHFVHVAEDPDAAWARIAPHALHENDAYAAWAEAAGLRGPYERAGSADALRARGTYAVWTPETLVERVRALGAGAIVTLHPLMGGLDPDLAWESLELIEKRALPALAEAP